MFGVIKKWRHDQRGQALSEYGLLIAIIAVALVAVLITFRDKLAGAFKKASDTISAQNTGSANPN